MALTHEERNANSLAIHAANSKKGRDIAPLPKIANKKRRLKCQKDFRAFCETYYADVFKLAWSDDHLKAIARIQEAILQGGLFAFAFPRGSGKTSLLVVAAEWALLYGHRSFVVLIGATEDAATDLLHNIKIDFETNDLLAADFPAAIYPIRKMEMIVKRAAGQLYEGNPTRMTWTANEIVLPTIPKSVSSGAAIKVAGITGRIRGMSSQKSDGTKIRPDFVLIDDPQTDESARSPKGVADRMKTISGTILGLAGPGKKIAGFAAVTVVAKADVADQLLDQKTHPEWQGERIKLLKSLPTDLKLWEQYAEIRGNGLREGKGLAPATDFYRANQVALDVGAEASWLARFNPDEASAIQHAMNHKLTSEEAFAAEYQNSPLSIEIDTPLMLKPEHLTNKIVDIKRGIVPIYATKLVAFVDCQATVLYYTVVAFGDNYSSHIVDYGCYPEQTRSHFYLADVKPSLKDLHPNIAAEGQLRAGLDSLAQKLLDRDWQYEDANTKQIDRMIIDSGYQQDIVKQFTRESKFKARLLPSKGYGIKADRKPLDSWELKTGGRRGWSWIYNRGEGHILYDTNAWKSFLATRILSQAGEAGNLSLYSASPTQHRMIAEHVTAEYPVPTEGMGRCVNVWQLKPARENHWLDCLVGCMVAASEQGILFTGHSSGNRTQKRKKLNVTF